MGEIKKLKKDVPLVEAEGAGLIQNDTTRKTRQDKGKSRKV